MEIKNNKLKILLMAAISLLFTFTALYLLKNMGHKVNMTHYPFLLFGILFFGYAAMIYSEQLLLQNKAITLDENGFTERTYLVNWGVIDIQDISGFRMLSGPFISVDLFDSSKYVNRLNPFAKLLYMLNKLFGYIVVINTSIIDEEPEKLVEKLNQKLNELKGLNKK